jgi:hypothetical protein
VEELRDVPTLVIEPGQTKEHTQFQVYQFLVEKFDKAYVGYPVIFLFPNEKESRTKVFLSASEVGARVADNLEAREGSSAILYIEKDGTMLTVYFQNAETKTVDLRILEMPVIGSC